MEFKKTQDLSEVHQIILSLGADSVRNILDKVNEHYEPSRFTQNLLTKLEEAMHWLGSIVSNQDLRVVDEENVINAE